MHWIDDKVFDEGKKINNFQRECQFYKFLMSIVVSLFFSPASFIDLPYKS